jgi:hypothetical protein
MADYSERLLSGELSGREYFKLLEDEGINDGTLVYAELGMLQRSDSAPPLEYLPGQEPPQPLNKAQKAAVERFLTMPTVYFIED